MDLQQTVPPRRILRTREAAAYLGVSAAYLEKKRMKGGGPRFVRLGGRVVGYELQALEDWLRECASDAKAR